VTRPAAAALAALWLVGWALPAAAEDSPVEVRRELGAAPHPVPTAQTEALIDRCLGLASAAITDSDFLGAMSAAAAVCAASDPGEAHVARARCLPLVAAGFRDSRRWSTLLSEAFAPPLEAFTPGGWHGELAAYDSTLVSLTRNPALGPRARYEIQWARVWVRLNLDRNLDRITGPERARTLEILDDLEREAGQALVPGEPVGSRVTYGARARAARYELTELCYRITAPEASGVDLAGESLSTGDLQGRVVVLDFWNTFCAPCLELVPHVRGILARDPDAPLTVLGVNGDQTPEEGTATAARVGMTWPSFWDGPQGAIARAYMVQSWPRVFVLDGEGRIRFKFTGADAVQEGLEPAIQTLLEESGYRRP